MSNAPDELLTELRRLADRGSPVLVEPRVLRLIADRVCEKPPGPSDEQLEAMFRDFAEGQTAKEWRRKVYERCAADAERRRL